MTNEEQLAWEERAGKPVALAAFGSALAGFLGWLQYQSAIADRADGTDGFLEAVDQNAGDFTLGGLLQAGGLLLLIPPLYYLYRAVRHRRPELTQAAAILLLLGALTYAATTVIQQAKIVEIAHDFFPFDVPDDLTGLKGDDYAEAVDPDKAAEKAVRDDLSPALQGIGLGGSFALAFAVIMLAVNAIRVGLLSRFIGVLGIGMGVMFVIPFGVQPILQLFWLAALGVLFMGRWPGGRGPAWQTGDSIPWPGAAQQREEIERRRAEREQQEDAQAAAARPKRSSRKRKRR